MNRDRVLIILALLVFTSAVYAQVRHHEFVDFDDLVGIVHNEDLDVDSIPDAFRKAIHARIVHNWIPLTVLSLQLDRALWGKEATGMLLTNVALHAAASVLLFLALASMTRAVGASAFVAAVFAVHPLHVESVAWASERKDVLSGFFWMAMLLAWARYANQGSRSAYAAALIAFILGLLSKPMIVTAPFVLLLLDFWPLKRLDRRAFVEKIPMFVLVAVVCWITVAVQYEEGAARFGASIPLAARLFNAVDSYMIYLVKSFWPTQLAPFYVHPMNTLPFIRVAGGGALLAGITAAVVVFRHKRPYLLTGWLWFAGTLVPVIGIVQVGSQARADRYMYVPLIGLTLAVAWASVDTLRGRLGTQALSVAGSAAVLALAAVSWVQVGYWSDSVTLFTRDLVVEPDSYYAHKVLATLRLREEQLEQAEFHYERVFELNPDEGRANMVRFHLGMAYIAVQQGNSQEAINRYRAALRVDPEHGRANGQLGIALTATERGEDAIPHLERAIAEYPDQAPLHLALGVAHASRGRFDAATLAIQAAIRAAQASGQTQLIPRLEAQRAHYQALAKPEPALVRPGAVD